jgi:hypothetical protein
MIIEKGDIENVGCKTGGFLYIKGTPSARRQ